MKTRFLITIGTATMLCGGSLSARPADNLVLVPTSGAALAFVGPASEPSIDPAEEAIQSFSRALSQANAVDQQRTEALCRAGQPQGLSPEQRFTWAATCRYNRR